MKPGTRHSEESKIRIGRGVTSACAERRNRPVGEKPSYSTRYRHIIRRLRILEEQVERRWLLDEKSVSGRLIDFDSVKTCGACLPATGALLWKGGAFSLVWFVGCDRPTVWPSADLEVVEVDEK